MLLIFIKNLVAGKVKTRLAATVGDAEALRIYRYLLAHTQLAATAFPGPKTVWYSDAVDQQDNWPNEVFSKKQQQGTDLGARMEHAFHDAFQEGAERALIIGSDCPELTADILMQAWETLLAHDFVLGPTSDGGYYLLGMRAFQPAVFQNIPWSTHTVLLDTLAVIREKDFSYALLPERSDIDTEADWRAYLDRVGFQPL